MIRAFLKYWLPVLLWCAVIFGASADKSSGQRSSRIIAPIIRFFIPNISEHALDRIVHYTRKTAHMTEYAILALFLWNALDRSREVRPDSVEPSAAAPNPRKRAKWSWRIAGLAFVLAALYASTDEFHQAFVPSRTAQIFDVFIDSAGAALGLFALWFAGRWRKVW